ncbi:hypothetical protein ACX27_16615 [Nostoc piscinale CENA21]|uniref:Uncharacterized protein n=1 Tax=Nostoc piscinale CENA21 TaxID=224013 RepID=A0A0M4SM41_9NOSO|nr:prolipoprotein diacylglyceryl transferase family protein [Nostoc piscinale]ALF54098.1 hypothetical protein ACX27_16615 [Nostoc piscinale CENA21]
MAFRLLLCNVRKDAIAPRQRSSVILGGMLGALIGAQVLVALQHLDLIWQNSQQFSLLLYRSGELFKFYLISYVIFRFFIDFLKPDFHTLFGLSAIQIACVLAILYYLPSIPQVFYKPAQK